jgi:hypothetical protein
MKRIREIYASPYSLNEFGFISQTVSGISFWIMETGEPK